MWLLEKRKEASLDEGAMLSPLRFLGSDHEYALRGLAGTVLVYKIAGALAARGGSLDDVYNIAEYVSSRLGTIGVGMEHCHVSPRRTFTIYPRFYYQLDKLRFRVRKPHHHTYLLTSLRLAWVSITSPATCVYRLCLHFAACFTA